MTHTKAKLGYLDQFFVTAAGALMASALATSPAIAANQNDANIVMDHSGYEQLDTAFGKAAGTTALFSDASGNTIATTLDTHAAHPHTAFTPNGNTDHNGSIHYGCGGGNEGHTIKFNKDGSSGYKADTIIAATGNKQLGYVDAEFRGWFNGKIADKRFCVMSSIEMDTGVTFFRNGGPENPTYGFFENWTQLKIGKNLYAGSVLTATMENGRKQFLAVSGGVTLILPGDIRTSVVLPLNGGQTRLIARGSRTVAELPLIDKITPLRKLVLDAVLDYSVEKNQLSARLNAFYPVGELKIAGQLTEVFLGCGINTAHPSYFKNTAFAGNLNCSVRFEAMQKHLKL